VFGKKKIFSSKIDKIFFLLRFEDGVNDDVDTVVKVKEPVVS
jgi:hypothetical protein